MNLRCGQAQGKCQTEKSVALLRRRIERGEIRDDVDDVVVVETRHRLFHQCRIATVAPAVLEHVELAREVGGMTAGEPRHVAETVQRVAVANRALYTFAAAGLHQRLALFDAAGRNVRDKTGVRIAFGDARLILRQRDHTVAERLSAAFRQGIAYAAAAYEWLRPRRRFL